MTKQKKKFFNFRLMPVMLLVAIAGILLISLLNFAYALVACCLFLLALTLVAICKKSRKYIAIVVVLFTTFVVFVASGAIMMNKSTKVYLPVSNATISGVINSSSDVYGSPIDYSDLESYYLVLTDVKYYTQKCENLEELDGKVGVYLPLSSEIKFKVGDKIIINADIEPKKVNLTESVSVHNFISGVQFNLKNAKFVDLVQGKASFGESIKVRVRDAMLKYVPSGDIMFSMVFGSRNVMSDEFVSSSNLTGLAHLFAVSGLHLGLIAGFVTWICKKCKANKFVDYIIVLLLSGLYALLVGFGPSVARAFLMLTIYKSGRLFGLRHCGMSSLSLSGLIILLINPLMLFNMSFQLTFMAIIGLLFFSLPLSKIIKTKFKSFNKFVVTVLSVNIGVLPIMLHYFGSVSLIVLFANILIVPFVTLVFPFVFTGIILACIFPPFAYVLLPLGYVFSFVEFVVMYLAKVPFFAINLKLSVFWIILYLAFLVLISSYSLISKKPKTILASIMIVVIMVSNIIVSFGRIDGSVKIESIANESNYSLVMVEIENKHYLVSSGELLVQAIYTCTTFMQEKNIKKIDGLVKSNFESKDFERLAKYKQALNIEKLVTSTIHDGFKDLFGDNILISCMVGDYIFAPINESIVELVGKGGRVLFVDNLDDNDIALSGKAQLIYLLGNSNIAQQMEYGYLVNDGAVLENIAQSQAMQMR